MLVKPTQDESAQVHSLHRSTAVAEFWPDGRVAWANDRFLALFGYRLEDLVGRHHAVLCERSYATSPDYSLFWSRLRSGAYWEGEFSRVCADGRQIWIAATYTPVVDSEGRVAKVVKFANDITELKVRIADFESRMLALDRAHAIAEYALDGRLIHANENFLQLMGCQLDEILGRPHSQFVDAHEASSDAYAELWDRLRRGEVVTGRFRRVGHGREVWLQATYNPLFGTHAEVRGVVEVATNITSEIQLEQRNFRQATTDSLTGLANRAAGVGALAAAIDRASVSSRDGAAAIFIDLDEFKIVNDEFGHRVGDEVLQRAAERLDLARPPGATLARLGGDEFLVVLSGDVDELTAVQSAERLLGELRGPVLVDGRLAMVDGSAGVAVARPETFVPSELLRQADAAVYAAKHRGKGRVAIYDDDLRDQATRQRHVTQLLERAIESHAVVVHYQPIVELSSASIVGVEALCRLADEDGTTIPPSSFIEIAERSHLINRLDLAVLDTALGDLAGWVRQGSSIDLSVNFSRRHLHDPHFSELVVQTLQRHELSPDRLVVEVTETLPLSSNGTAVKVLRELQEAGIRVAIDDFGTGHTSVGTLRDLPVDIVKIDRSFLTDVETARQRVLFELLVGSARSLELVTVAEGVEHPSQLTIAREAGCDLVQGYLLGRPVPAEQVKLDGKEVSAAVVGDGHLE